MHLHWIVWVYRDFEPQSGNYLDMTTLDLVAGDYYEALERAAKIYPKELKGERGGYRVASVIEHFDGDCR